ncbi:MAG: SCP2 sterol-binding domain-containing protein [Promethearchaeia archaeon]
MRDLKKVLINLTKSAESKGQFKEILFRFINFVISIIENNEELLEEFKERNFIYQLHIRPYDFSFWVSNTDGELNFGGGTNPNPDLLVEMDKEIFIKILEEKIKGRVAYMKGLIKAKGDLTKGMIFINGFEHLFDYLRSEYQEREK